MIPNFKFCLDEGLDESFLPTRSEPNATGWDVRAAKDIEIAHKQTVLIPLGFKIISPPGWWLELRPRSSTHAKKHLLSLYGVIDNDFFGNCFLCVTLIDHTKGTIPLTIEKGERIGQLIPYKLQDMNVEKISSEEFDQLSAERKTIRSPEGFGSSGTK